MLHLLTRDSYQTPTWSDPALATSFGKSLDLKTTNPKLNLTLQLSLHPPPQIQAQAPAPDPHLQRQRPPTRVTEAPSLAASSAGWAA